MIVINRQSVLIAILAFVIAVALSLYIVNKAASPERDHGHFLHLNDENKPFKNETNTAPVELKGQHDNLVNPQKMSYPSAKPELTERELLDLTEKAENKKVEIAKEMARYNSDTLTAEERKALKQRVRVLTQEYNQLILPLALKEMKQLSKD